MIQFAPAGFLFLSLAKRQSKGDFEQFSFLGCLRRFEFLTLDVLEGF